MKSQADRSGHRVEDVLEKARVATEHWHPDHLCQELIDLQQIATEYHELYQEKIGRLFSDSELIIDEATLRRWESQIKLLHKKQVDPSLVLGPILHDIYKLVHVELKTYQQKIQRWAKRIAIEANYAEPFIEFRSFLKYLSKDTVDLMDRCLVHCIQNALAHGFESSEERVRLGKPTHGSIILGFQKSLDRVLISIHDDGRGLNLRAIETIARERGLLRPGERITPALIETCLFTSGFSSAREVSKVAGRGVGLDAVKKFLLEADGHISLELGQESQDFCPFTLVLNLPGELFPDVESYEKMVA